MFSFFSTKLLNLNSVKIWLNRFERSGLLVAVGLNPPLPKAFGGERVRTDDLLRARQTLSQLSYTPYCIPVGLSGIEPPTLRLSVVRSNQLSYRPDWFFQN
jgi:hypothetical protein